MTGFTGSNKYEPSGLSTEVSGAAIVHVVALFG